MAAAALDEYDAEYRGHVQAAEEKLAVAESSGANSDAAIGAAERATEAAKDVVQLMELEGRQLSGPGRTRLQSQLRAFRDEIAALRARIKKCRQSNRLTPQKGEQDRIREEMFARSGNGGSDDENARMLSNNERMSKGTDRLKGAHAVTLDMEDTANAILGDLSKQRETIMHARGTLSMASEKLDSSKRILNQMARRAMMNKATLYVVIALLVGMLLLLGWSSNSSPTKAAGGGGADGAVSTSAGGDWQRSNN